MERHSKVSVLGAGSWGTALANHLTKAGHEVVLWGNEPHILEAISEKQIHPDRLPGAKFVRGIRTEGDIVKAVAGARWLVLSVPSGAMREVIRLVRSILDPSTTVVSTAKGLEKGSHFRMSEVLTQELGASAQVAVLSGPSFAAEVVQGCPTAVTVASRKLELAEQTAQVFHYDYFRVYSSDDVIGVELGGVLKNVIAIAAGMVDGVGIGSNARAALITRGLSEMNRLAAALGANPQTLMGLSGLGDLLLTATGDLSRNRQVGMRLGQGETLEAVVKDLGEVAEGVSSTPVVLELAEKHNVVLPITAEVGRVLSGACSVQESVQALLSRMRKSER